MVCFTDSSAEARDTQAETAGAAVLDADQTTPVEPSLSLCCRASVRAFYYS